MRRQTAATARARRARPLLYGAIAVAAIVPFVFLLRHHPALPNSTSSSSSSRDRRIILDAPSSSEDKHTKDPWPTYEPTSDAERLWLGLSMYSDYDDGGGAADAIDKAAGDADLLSAMATAPPPADKVEAEVLCEEDDDDQRCDSLRVALESLSGLRIRAVRGALSPCRDDERRPPAAALLERRKRLGKAPPPRPPPCAEWARAGKCLQEPRDSLRRCAATCGFCERVEEEEQESGMLARLWRRQRRRPQQEQASGKGNNTKPPPPCRDVLSACPLLARAGQCALIPEIDNELNLVALSCPRSCGRCGERAAEVAAAARAASRSITGEGAKHPWGDDDDGEEEDEEKGGADPQKPKENKPKKKKKNKWGPCDDKDARCAEWAAQGECGRNPDWMGRHCGLTCGRCVGDSDGGWAPAISRAVATGAPLQLLRAMDETDEERLAAEAQGLSPARRDARDAERRRRAALEASAAEGAGAGGGGEDFEVALVGRALEAHGDAGGNGVDCGGGGPDGASSSSSSSSCLLPLVPAGVPGCRDRETPARCAEWAGRGECLVNSLYMSEKCAASCGLCWSYRTRGGGALAAVRLGGRKKKKRRGVESGDDDDGGVLLPTIGFGTAGFGGEGRTRRAVRQALELGYGMVDTACAREWYRQDEVGEAVREWVGEQRGGGEEGGARAAATPPPPPPPPARPFLVTKIHPRDLGYDATLQAARRALTELGVERVGLLLLHYPRCWDGVEGCRAKGREAAEAEAEAAAAAASSLAPPPEDDSGLSPPGAERSALWRASWRALERLRREGVAQAIGVSNFSIEEFRELLAMPAAEGEWGAAGGGGVATAAADTTADAAALPRTTTTVDAVEVRLDPFDASTAAVVREALHRGVAVLAYSTLGTQHAMAAGGGGEGGGGGGDGGAGGDGSSSGSQPSSSNNTNPVLSSPVLARIAHEHPGRTVAQVALRWALQRGAAVLPRSASREHAADNLRLLDFSLTDAQMDAIDGLPWGAGGGEAEAEVEEGQEAEVVEGEEEQAASGSVDGEGAAEEEAEEQGEADPQADASADAADAAAG
jgi:diketogulonate reductase-like aldo/keto reductase